MRTTFRDGRPHYVIEDHGHTTPCWVWQGALACGRSGYGRLNVGGRLVPAHRYYYEHVVGPIPERLVLDHLCGTTRCVNPAHLEPVTQTENVRRALALISEGDATEIRQRFRAHMEARTLVRRKHVRHGFRQDLAREYGVSVNTVKNVLYGRRSR
jgi:hypothetical protein